MDLSIYHAIQQYQLLAYTIETIYEVIQEWNQYWYVFANRTLSTRFSIENKMHCLTIIPVIILIFGPGAPVPPEIS